MGKPWHGANRTESAKCETMEGMKINFDKRQDALELVCIIYYTKCAVEYSDALNNARESIKTHESGLLRSN
jgi:hypothetical protein